VDLRSVDLITATLDLRLVRMLRHAMAAADKNGCTDRCDRFCGSVIEPRKRIHPTPQFEPRPHVHPTPRFEPRPVIHPTPAANSQEFVSTPPSRPIKSAPVFQPPWRVLPWEKIAPPAPKLKLIVKPPDPARRGSVFDVFI
jgi:hypothetical protein